MEQGSTFEETLNSFRSQFSEVPVERPVVKIPNARKRLFAEMFCRIPNFKWLPEYEHIAEWMTDNKGKCLLLYGDKGRGKTEFSRYVFPFIYYMHTVLNGEPRVFTTVSATELGSRLDELRNKRLLVIDDVGSDNAVVNNYGNKINPMFEILDACERNGSLLIISTNLNAEDMKEYFGVRGFDRLQGLFKSVLFQGESMRNN